MYFSSILFTNTHIPRIKYVIRSKQLMNITIIIIIINMTELNNIFSKKIFFTI